MQTYQDIFWGQYADLQTLFPYLFLFTRNAKSSFLQVLYHASMKILLIESMYRAAVAAHRIKSLEYRISASGHGSLYRIQPLLSDHDC